MIPGRSAMLNDPDLRQAIPVLPALNVGASLSFYEERLGFARLFEHDDYGAVRRGDVTIHFWLCEDRRIAENSSCRINVAGIDALYEEFSAKGVVHHNGELQTKPWGLREFTIVDVNGNCLVFAEPLPV